VTKHLPPIEAQRREFLRTSHELYAYVTAHEVSRALDHAADLIAGASSGNGAANRLWHWRSTIEGERHQAIERSLRDEAAGT
jgi:hypothetical protein